MMSSSRESSVTRNMPTARSNSRPFHDKTFEKQDRSAGVGTEMYKAITATQVSFFAACLHPFYFFLYIVPSPSTILGFSFILKLGIEKFR